MVRFEGRGSHVRPERLLVFECRGAHPPRGEPRDDGFLGIWPEPPFYYLFFAGEPDQGLSQWLGEQRGWMISTCYHLDYEQWQQVGAARLQVGPFLIEMVAGVSSGDQTAASGGRTLIRIDPGLVFGSGLHGSTRGCLLALAGLFARSPLHRVVDMGTGTGILALSCAALGAARVVAVDNNPLALRTAKRNVFLNSQQHCVALLRAEDLRAIGDSSDLLVMNLEAPILQRLLGQGEWLDYPWVILSGFLKRQWDQLMEFIPAVFRVRGLETVDGWLTVTLSQGRLE
jgi:ribosomal protein L11 methyltransferase